MISLIGRRLVFGFLFLCTVLAAVVAKADDSETWGSLQVEQEINDKWGTYGELILRHSQAIDEYRVLGTRFGFTYKFMEGWRAAYLAENRSTDAQRNNEFRNITQVSGRYDWDAFRLSTRARWETRKFADSEAWMNRFRLQFRGDVKAFEIAGVTPFLSTEQFYIANSVGTRRAGSQENRSQVGLSTEFWGAGWDLAYMNRRVYQPGRNGQSSNETRYNVFNIVAKLKF